MADSKRQQKFSKMIRKDLGEIFSRELQGRFSPALPTVSHVKITPDLSKATVYVSVLPNQYKEQVVGLIQENTSEIRGILGRKIGKHVRVVPELQFFYDDLMDEVDKIDKIFKNIDPIKPEDED